MMFLAGLAALFVGNAYQAQMPGFASDLGHGDPGVSYSMLLAADAAGALVAGFVLESKGLLHPSARTALLLAMAWCIALGVFALMIYYNFKIKGAGGFVHELLSAPFGAHPLLWIPNLALNIIEFVAKTVSLGMRLFGNMYAGELLFLLIALLGSIWSFGADTTVLGFIGHVIAGSVWAVFHILIVLLQAFIFMMLTLVYIGQAHDSH